MSDFAKITYNQTLVWRIAGSKVEEVCVLSKDSIVEILDIDAQKTQARVQTRDGHEGWVDLISLTRLRPSELESTIDSDTGSAQNIDTDTIISQKTEEIIYEFATLNFSQTWSESDKEWKNGVNVMKINGVQQKFDTLLEALNVLGKEGYAIVATIPGPSSSSGGTGSAAIREGSDGLFGFFGSPAKIGGAATWTSTDWIINRIILQKQLTVGEIIRRKQAKEARAVEDQRVRVEERLRAQKKTP